jgi:proline iminopeptidase
MTPRYPSVEPHERGMLSTDDGNEVYWEVCGNPEGKPAIVLHGGPGSGAIPWWRRLFDPNAYRIVLLDQRGCGRSRPTASDPSTNLEQNTTHHLLSDLEGIRTRLGIERWLVLGGSWGSTLGLAYGERFPKRVTEMVLFSVVTTTRREVEWITRGIGRMFPEAWSRFRDGVPVSDRDGSLVDAYSRLLESSDPSVREGAARNWCDWEDAHVSLGPNPDRSARFEDAKFRLGFARLVTHYWRHSAWLGEDELLQGPNRLEGIPAVLLHGRLDLSSPLDVPWRLSSKWESSRLIILEDSGHGGGTTMSDAVVSATDQFSKAP